jgi:hypothetical protein
MVAWPGHPHLPLPHLTFLLSKIRKMMKKAKKKMTTMSEASRRPRQQFLVLNDKGEKYQLKLEGSTQFVLVSVLSGKIRLFGFVNRNVRFCLAEFISYSFLVDLRTL